MQRVTRTEMWSYFEARLASGEVAERGHMACLDLSNGTVVVGQTDPNLLPCGYFDEDKTGNGTLTVRVRFFGEKELHRWTNDANPNDVQASDLGNVCFIKDSRTVSMLGTGRSVAGRIWGVTSAGVLVEMADTLGLQGPEGPPGA